MRKEWVQQIFVNYFKIACSQTGINWTEENTNEIKGAIDILYEDIKNNTKEEKI